VVGAVMPEGVVFEGGTPRTITVMLPFFSALVLTPFSLTNTLAGSGSWRLVSVEFNVTRRINERSSHI
jgi:hypothetical protein